MAAFFFFILAIDLQNCILPVNLSVTAFVILILSTLLVICEHAANSLILFEAF